MFRFLKENEKLNNYIFILILILVSVFFRIYNLESLPPGLWVDEAGDGVDSLRIIQTNILQNLYADDRPGGIHIFIYFQALFVYIFGNNAWSLRFFSAIIGVSTIILFYLLLKSYWFSKTYSFVAAFLLSTSFWHVNFSRIAFKGILVPLFIIVSIYLFKRAENSKKLLDYVLAGIVTGIGMYTYFSFKVILLVFVLIIFYKLYQTYEKLNFNWELFYKYISFFLATLLLAFPLLYLFLFQHNVNFGREIQVSIFGPGKTLIDFINNIFITFNMFFFIGDLNTRHNISGFPMLGPHIAILFLIGLLKEIYNLVSNKIEDKEKSIVLLTWFIAFLLPGILTVSAPHALRTLGVVPVVFIFVTIGFKFIIENLSQFKYIFIVTFLTLNLLIDWNLYFKIWPSQKYFNEAFSVHLVNIAYWLNSANDQKTNYIIYDPYLIDHYPIMYLTNTVSRETQIDKRIYYVNIKEISSVNFPNEGLRLIFLNSNEMIIDELLKNNSLKKIENDIFSSYEN